MLVNANDFPGPALLQGIGFCLIALVIVFIVWREILLGKKEAAQDLAKHLARIKAWEDKNGGIKK